VSATFPSSDGVTLHADILRPKNLPAGTKTPVILSVGPYFNHSGQVGAAGPVQGTSYDPVGSAGPSDRFLDFIEGAKLMERGVTGLIGANHRVPGLEAVVSQEPVYDLYRYLYGDGIRRLNSVLTPALYDLIDLSPGPALDDPQYNVDGLNDSQRPGCPVLNRLRA
jgi:uncharacterized protein